MMMMALDKDFNVAFTSRVFCESHKTTYSNQALMLTTEALIFFACFRLLTQII